MLASGPPSSAAAVGPSAAAAAAVRKVRRLVPGASDCTAMLNAFWEGLWLWIGEVVFSAMGQRTPGVARVQIRSHVLSKVASFVDIGNASDRARRTGFATFTNRI